MNKIKLGNKYFYYQVFYKNNKNMYLRVKNDQIVITCNRSVSHKKIEDFILSNQENIMRRINTNQRKIDLYHQDYMEIFGKKYMINYQILSKQNKYSINDSHINIGFKKDYFDTKYIESIYKELTLEKMKFYYNEIYDFLSKDINIDNITFKTQLMKSRFGSCIPSKRIIKLNSILARFDENYIRIILIHELIHLHITNHQKDFYQYINKFIPNYKKEIQSLNDLNRKYVM